MGNKPRQSGDNKGPGKKKTPANQKPARKSGKNTRNKDAKKASAKANGAAATKAQSKPKPQKADKALERPPSALPWERQARSIYLREAAALEEAQPERAAMMWALAAADEEPDDAGARRAMAHLDKALDCVSDSSWLLAFARHEAIRHGRFARALSLGEREVALGGDNTRRAAILSTMARIETHIFGDRDKALGHAEQAQPLRRGWPAALLQGADLRLVGDDHVQAADTLEALADVLNSAQERALFLYTAGTLGEMYLDQPDRAERGYSRALEGDADHVPALLALALLHERRQRWSELCRVLERLAELVPDATSKARLLAHAGAVHLERTGNLASATRDFRGSADADGPSRGALFQLAYTLEAAGRHKELVRTLNELLALVDDDVGQADLLCRIGRVRAHDLGDDRGAIKAYNKALEAVEGYMPAISALTALHARRGEHDELLALLAFQTETVLPDGVRAARAIEAAELLASLERYDEAVERYQRALAIQPRQRAALWGLRRLLRRLKRWKDLAGVLAAEADVARDDETRTHVLRQLALVQAEHLHEVGAAVSTLSRAPEATQGRGVALDLIELQRRAGAHRPLIELLLAQSQATSDPEEARGYLIAAAGVLERDLGEHERALALYQEALAAEPRDALAMAGIERIARRLARWPVLVDLHRHRLRTHPDRPDAIEIQCDVGRILHEHLQNHKEAIAAYRKALSGRSGWAPGGKPSPSRRQASYGPALLALERLARETGQWSDLVSVLEASAEASGDRAWAADILVRAAQVADWQMGDLSEAAKHYSAALLKEGDHRGARHGLFRVRCRQGRWDDAASEIEQLANTAGHEHARCCLDLELARINEFRRKKSAPVDLYDRASQPGFSGRLRFERLRARRLAGDQPVADHLHMLGETSRDQRLAGAFFVEAAVVKQKNGANPGEILASASRAAECDGDDIVVTDLLEQALWRTERWREAGELRERMAKANIDAGGRVLGLAGAVRALMRAGLPDLAARSARECLNFDPRSLTALQALARLEEDASNWRELAALFDRLAAACHDATNRRDYGLRAASLWAEKVEDVERAIASLAVLLTDNPDLEEAFNLAETLYRQRRDYAELSRLYTRRIRACSDDVRKSLLERHARLLEQDLDDPARACAELEKLLELAPDDTRVIGQLAELLKRQRRWADASAMLERLAEASEDLSVRHTALLERAELLLDRLYEPDRAAESLELAAESGAADPRGARLRIRLARTLGAWQDARSHLESFIKASKHPRDVAWGRLQLAQVAEQGMWEGNLQAKYRKEALAGSIGDEAALRVVVDDYRERRALDEFVKAADGIAEGLKTSQRHELQRSVAVLLIDELARPIPGRQRIQKLMEEGVDDPDLRLLYGRALVAEGQPGDAALQYRAALVLAPSRLDAYEALRNTERNLGRIHTARAAESILRCLGGTGDPNLDMGPGLPAGSLELDKDLPLPTELGSVQVLIEALVPYLADVYPQAMAGTLVEEDTAVRNACINVARRLGLGSIDVAVGGSSPAVGRLGQPITIVLSQELVRSLDSPLFRYHVSVALALAHRAGTLVQRLTNEDLDVLVEAVYAGWTVSDPNVKTIRTALGRSVPRQVRKDLKNLPQPQPTKELWQLYRKSELERAEKVGMLVSGDPGAVLASMAASQGMALADALGKARWSKLLRFCLSEDYHRLGQKLAAG